MKWIRVASRISQDVKIWRLAELAECDAYKAVGHLVDLWGAMTEQAKDGDISRVSDAMLERWAGWDGRRGAFAAGVREILCDETGVVAAWEKYQGAAIREHEADRRRKSTKRPDGIPPEPPPETPAENGRNSGKVPPLRYETIRDDTTSTTTAGDARGASEPPALALVRQETPETPPRGEPREPAPPAVAVAVVRNGARPPARPRPRTHDDLRGAIAAWVDECRSDGQQRRDADHDRRHLAEVVFAYWQATWKKHRALYDEGRERLIVKRLTESGGDLSELFYAIDGARKDAYVRDQRKGDLGFILGARSRVEELAAKCAGYERETPHPRAESLARALAGDAPADPAEVPASA
jgi:hypothetical protein